VQRARQWHPMKSALLCSALAILPLSGAREVPSPVADHHQHLFSPAAVKLSPGVAAIDAGDLIRLLDAAGIQRAVVLSLAYQFGNPNKPAVPDEYTHVRAENDWTSQQVARFPDRLRAFCSFNPLKDYALDELARCAADPRLRTGLKLHFGNSDVDLADAAHVTRLQQVFRAANDHRMAILVHLRSSVSRKRPYGQRYARTFIEELLPAAPDVPVQVAHLGGAGGYQDPLADEVIGVFADAIATRDPRVARLCVDISGVAGLGDWRPRADLIATRIRQLGLDRVFYGSDGATDEFNPQRAVKAFRELPLSEAELRAIATNVAPYLR
jgi:uncharacterized protein